eukprot:TRINITY_DN7763_c0_g1_i1.p1 TRINITY_DN7763_c0_g1~~TRINITY_DN7763_c0_g1_i1.p1  ORF type:complete len:407 (+),score=95.28 TRINITY_DN7763_c0_g1_i1:72-1223(+)
MKSAVTRAASLRFGQQSLATATHICPRELQFVERVGSRTAAAGTAALVLTGATVCAFMPAPAAAAAFAAAALLSSPLSEFVPARAHVVGTAAGTAALAAPSLLLARKAAASRMLQAENAATAAEQMLGQGGPGGGGDGGRVVLTGEEMMKWAQGTGLISTLAMAVKQVYATIAHVSSGKGWEGVLPFPVTDPALRKIRVAGLKDGGQALSQLVHPQDTILRVILVSLAVDPSELKSKNLEGCTMAVGILTEVSASDFFGADYDLALHLFARAEPSKEDKILCGRFCDILDWVHGPENGAVTEFIRPHLQRAWKQCHRLHAQGHVERGALRRSRLFRWVLSRLSSGGSSEGSGVLRMRVWQFRHSSGKWELSNIAVPHARVMTA